MGFFAGTNKAEARGTSNKLHAGRYDRVVVTSCKWVDGFNGKYYVVNLLVDGETVRTDTGELSTDTAKTPQEPHPLGSEPCWTTRMDDSYGIGPSEAKAFALACLGTDDETVDVEGPLEKSLSGGFDGVALQVNAFRKMTGNKRVITVCQFAPCEAASAGQVAKAKDESPEAPPPAPPPEVHTTVPETPENAPGGPWYAFPTPDPRGTHYNAAQECRSF